MKYIEEILFFFKHIYENRNLIFVLAYNDFKERYMGSYLGVFWSILRPLLFIIVIWFVFEIGFKTPPSNNVPFFLWLLVGFIPWFFFTESVLKGTNAIISNSFLVKKVAFRSSILPIIKIVSSLYVHLVLLFLLVIILMIKGYFPTIYWLQIPYYIMCVIFLSFGLVLLISSLRVFIKDIEEIVQVAVQFGFWLTPIFWSLSILPEKYQLLLKLNPMVYIIEGFKDTFFNNVWFWEKMGDTAQFLCINFIILLIGIFVFRKLRPHFGDVL